MATNGNLEQFLVTSLAADGGGSGLGMSHYSTAAICGAKASKLIERRALQEPRQVSSGKDKFAVGTVFHKLHELWHFPVEGITLDYQEPIVNESVAEGMRLFQGWQKHWPKYLWGIPHGAEVQIPAEGDAVTAAAIRGMFNGADVTAKLDSYVTMNELQVSEAENLRGVKLNGPGTYVLDYKTSDSPLDDIWYMNSLQAKWYPAALELIRPDLDIKGMIFDITYKFGRRKDKSMSTENFHAVFANKEATALDYLQGFITQGTENIKRYQEQNKGNRSACMEFSFGGVNLCPFFGSCDSK